MRRFVWWVVVGGVLFGGGATSVRVYDALTRWEGAGHPTGSKAAELEVLDQYARDVDAIHVRHGRTVTEECEAEWEEAAKEMRRKLKALRGR